MHRTSIWRSPLVFDGQSFRGAGVEISWRVSDRDDVAAYHIYRRLPEENKYAKAATVKTGAASFINSKFIAGKINVYAISISTASGESEKSIGKRLLITIV